MGSRCCTHVDPVAVELLRHQVSKVDAHSLAKQEGAVVGDVDACSHTATYTTAMRQMLSSQAVSKGENSRSQQAILNHLCGHATLQAGGNQPC